MKTVDHRVGRPHRRTPTKRIILNVPSSLWEQVWELAERERRPLSTQVQVLIEYALAERPPLTSIDTVAA